MKTCRDCGFSNHDNRMSCDECGSSRLTQHGSTSPDAKATLPQRGEIREAAKMALIVGVTCSFVGIMFLVSGGIGSGGVILTTGIALIAFGVLKFRHKIPPACPACYEKTVRKVPIEESDGRGVFACQSCGTLWRGTYPKLEGYLYILGGLVCYLAIVLLAINPENPGHPVSSGRSVMVGLLIAAGSSALYKGKQALSPEFTQPEIIKRGSLPKIGEK